jgi:uncharacterized protein (DUF111 family)
MPVWMKKGRAGFVVSVICREENLEKIEKVFFETTSTIGIRKYKVSRTELRREVTSFNFSMGRVNVKLGFYKGNLVNFKPEFEDIKQMSLQKKISYKEVLNAFYREFKP